MKLFQFSRRKLFKYILRNNFSDVVFLDFEKFPLNNSNYGDFGHLNYIGSEIFSRWFSYLLSNGLIEACDKQKFVDEAIKMQIEVNKNKEGF